MNNILCIALLVVGIVLLVYGFQSSQSVLSDLARLYSGSLREKTLWLLLAGAIATVMGAGGLLHNSKSG